MKSLIVLASVFAAQCSFAEFRVGIIGCDTSHTIAFTEIMNVKRPDFAKGFRVVSAYQWGSKDIVSATNRYPRYIAQLKEMGVEMKPSVAALVESVDAVCLETNDGREHLAQALEVFASGKPVFIDKPLAHDLKDALKILAEGRRKGAKFFTSSVLRYSDVLQDIWENHRPEVVGGDFVTPSPLEEQGTHSRYAWYGIHGFEPLVTAMGTGAVSVRTLAYPPHDIVLVRYRDGRVATLRCMTEYGCYGGTVYLKGNQKAVLGGYEGYEKLLVKILGFFKTGVSPVPPEETEEIFRLMDAAERSRSLGGTEVAL